MVAQTRDKVTLAEFEAVDNLPENSEKILELIGGEIFEVPSNPYASKIAGWILTALNLFLRQNDLGHVTGADGGYIVNGEVYAPDVAYISYARQPELTRKGYNPNPPDMAVEVISDVTNADEQRHLRLKLSSYLAARVTVWVVNPASRLVEVHRPGKAALELTESDTLTAEDILPGFALPVKDIFPPAKTA